MAELRREMLAAVRDLVYAEDLAEMDKVCANSAFLSFPAALAFIELVVEILDEARIELGDFVIYEEIKAIWAARAEFLRKKAKAALAEKSQQK